MNHTQTAASSATESQLTADRSANAIRHPKCGGWWTGVGRSHCASCCRTFSCDSAADKHRIGTHGVDRRCANPVDVGLVARAKPFGELWGWPSSDSYDPAGRRNA